MMTGSSRSTSKRPIQRTKAALSGPGSRRTVLSRRISAREAVGVEKLQQGGLHHVIPLDAAVVVHAHLWSIFMTV